MDPTHCDNQATPISCNLQCYALRLKPGQELKSHLVEFVQERSLTSAFVLTCVGSVTKARLRMANADYIKVFDGPFEIVSLVGTLSGGKSGHLHISLSDKDGHVIGGHVMGDLFIHSTAEIVIGSCSGVRFTREFDPDTDYDELVVSKTVTS
ncbi:bifunctional protein GlmU-like [Gigantopelta aegis]|uniref:bifunctional protein GlmU-like n=1 Tax=Gigantopelta aegis TaxID=1735272 RepID=UPI001B88C344|nr:bifunctional protein GlmU-like [Gigantopelta aegis]XP_041354519.1 bifunctional protein GlmU-like [Gigantopelta aegis]